MDLFSVMSFGDVLSGTNSNIGPFMRQAQPTATDFEMVGYGFVLWRDYHWFRAGRTALPKTIGTALFLYASDSNF